MQEFILELLKALAIQIGGLFGIFFAFGFVLSKLQEWTQQNYSRSVGWKGVLWTAWFGTPFHEYGHVFFAKIFHHKIDEIALFRPNALTGNLGHVNHSWNQKSFYQSVGNFFIGSAPMIFGSLMLTLLLYLLVPNHKEIFSALEITNPTFLNVLQGIKNSLFNLFAKENITSGWFWLFMYLSFCLASHLAPSKPDRQGMWKGFILIIIVLVIINLLTLLIKIDITNYILTFSRWLNIFVVIFSYATIISLLHFILSYLILKPFRKY